MKHLRKGCNQRKTRCQSTEYREPRRFCTLDSAAPVLFSAGIVRRRRAAVVRWPAAGAQVQRALVLHAADVARVQVAVDAGAGLVAEELKAGIRASLLVLRSSAEESPVKCLIAHQL